MADRLVPVRPWQRVPSWWVCVECKQPAVGWVSTPGMVMFGCSDHLDDVGALPIERFGFHRAGGYAQTRMSWSLYLQSPYWRVHNALIRATRRRDVEAGRRLDVMTDELDRQHPTFLERIESA